MKTQLEMRKILYDNKPKIQKYKKFGKFKYEICTLSVQIETVIDGKVETSNAAKVGDYIITGPVGEKFVLTPEKFKSRYEIIDSEYATASGEFYGFRIDEPLEFIAPWGEKMIAEPGDFIGSSDVKLFECYRIEKNVFF